MNLRLRVPVLLLASVLLIGLPAVAQGMTVINGTVNASGDIFDSEGSFVGHCAPSSVVSTTPVVITSPAVVPDNFVAVPGGMVTKKVIKYMSAPDTVLDPSTTTTIIKSQESALAPAMTETKTVTTTTTNETAPFVSTTVRTYDMGKCLTSVLDTRRADLEQQLSGSDLPDALALRAELARISAEESASLATGPLDFGEALAMAQELDSINNRSVTLCGTTRLIPLVTLDRFGARQIAVRNMPLY